MQPVVVPTDEHVFHPDDIGSEDVADDVPDSEQDRAEPTDGNFSSFIEALDTLNQQTSVGPRAMPERSVISYGGQCRTCDA